MKNNLKSKIVQILSKYPFTRNDDVALMLFLWREYYPSRIHRMEPTEQNKEGRAYVFVDNIPELPREDHIKRIRARLQNVEKRFPPTDIRIAEKRFRNIKNWRTQMGYN